MSKRVNQIAKETGVKWQIIADIVNDYRRPQNNPNLPDLKNHANTLVFGEEDVVLEELGKRGLLNVAPKETPEVPAAEEKPKDVAPPVASYVKSSADVERERAEKAAAERAAAAAAVLSATPPAPVVAAPAPAAPATVSAPRPAAPPPLAPPSHPRGPSVAVPPRGMVSTPPTPPVARPASPAPVSVPGSVSVPPAANRPTTPPPISAPRPMGPPSGMIPPRPSGPHGMIAPPSRPPVAPPSHPHAGPAQPPAPPRMAPPVSPVTGSPPRMGPPPGVNPNRAPSLPPRIPQAQTGPAVPKGELKMLALKAPIIVRDFADQLGMRPFKLISELMDIGIFASMNSSIDDQVAVRVAERHGILLEVRHRGGAEEKKKLVVVVPKVDQDDPKLLKPRPPIVCILGHVDHGKTTLLDTIRQTNVVKGEFGGITQHIGAYQVEKDGQKITFIDTPGHAAFSNMRARGADVTDVAVLVVAADDGFMPQTMEALQHARNHNVPVIVAINKIDAKGANLDKVKKQMQERNLTPEDWGGETLTCPVSALKGDGIENLLANILVQAEIMELKANPNRSPEGVIMETQKEIGRGSTASVIVQKGTLRVGDALVCGPVWCRVKSLVDDKGRALKEAPPATPVKVIGWSDVPESGHVFKTVKNEKAARDEADENAFIIRQEAAAAMANEAELANPDDRRLSNDEAMALLFGQKDKKINFKVLIKSDVYGTAEALGACLEGIESTKIICEIVDIGVGPLNKNDVILAHSADATVVCFNVGKENGIVPLLKQHSVPLLENNIIYHMIDMVKDAMADRLPPETKEVKLGALEIRGVFPLGKGFVCGGLVTEGLLKRDARARVLRKNKVLADTRITGLKRLKDEANEVRAGLECGLSLENYDGFQVGDIIEAYEIQKIRASL